MSAAAPLSAPTQSDMATLIRQQSEASGGDFAYLLQTAKRESGLDPAAKATSSSATGLFQFTEETWLAMVQRHGARIGLGEEAAQITKIGNRYEASSTEARQAILALREDPAISVRLAAALTQDNAHYLKTRLGYSPNAGALYTAHFLGAPGAATLLTAPPEATAADLLPAAARANPSIFYGDGTPKTVAGVLKSLQAGFDQPALNDTATPDASRPQQDTARRYHAGVLPPLDAPTILLLLDIDFASHRERRPDSA